MEHDAVDPTADVPEQLLAAYAVAERLERIRTSASLPGVPAKTITETKAYAPLRMSQGLRLILDGTYGNVLPEAVAILVRRNLLVPPYLLPSLLEKALQVLPEDPDYAADLIRIGGKRADWLAAQHPEWRVLSTAYDMATDWQREATPGRRLTLLQRWRTVAPHAAREALAEIWPRQSPKNQERLLEGMVENRSIEDHTWLLAQLAPKRKGVRRQLLRILLLAKEPSALEDMIVIAASAFDSRGRLRNVLDDPEGKERLQRYGGLQRNESLAEYLLRLLPPSTLPDLVGQTLSEFWAGLDKSQLKAAAEAVLAYEEPEVLATFTKFSFGVNPAMLPLPLVVSIAAAVPQEPFTALIEQLLSEEKNVFHYGGIARLLVLARRAPWSARISKAFILQLVATIREVRDIPYGMQQDLRAHWQLATPLLELSIFPWLRTQLHSMTERGDVFGKLATNMLQTMHFRKTLIAT
ncbi:MAG: DUF5691 domain-containing protein [Bacteroidota bacterium]